jgi:hypothetical protein
MKKEKEGEEGTDVSWRRERERVVGGARTAIVCGGYEVWRERYYYTTIF